MNSTMQCATLWPSNGSSATCCMRWSNLSTYSFNFSTCFQFLTKLKFWSTTNKFVPYIRELWAWQYSVQYVVCHYCHSGLDKGTWHIKWVYNLCPFYAYLKISTVRSSLLALNVWASLHKTGILLAINNEESGERTRLVASGLALQLKLDSANCQITSFLHSLIFPAKNAFITIDNHWHK